MRTHRKLVKLGFLSIHVIYKKYGKINEKKVMPKADIFLAYGEVAPQILIDKDYYLNENDLEKLKLVLL